MLSIFGLHNHPAQYGNILFSLPTLPNCENDANLIVFFGTFSRLFRFIVTQAKN